MSGAIRSGMGFPKGFVWGAATSSYQIEGSSAPPSVTEPLGRGPCIFDPWCRRAGAVYGGHTGDHAANHVGAMREDVALMKELGLKAYRFSIAWSRVLPEGVGSLNEKGLGFYSDLVDELLSNGIEPWATLFHWDLPLALERRGGWFNREIADWFGEYARIVTDRLGDRVSKWMTINEPQVIVRFGYGDATLAPAMKVSVAEQMEVGHNLLRAHGRGTQVIRARAKKRPDVGWAMVGRTDVPLDESSAADVEAARAGTMGTGGEREGQIAEMWNNTWYADPIFLGRYPDAKPGGAAPDVHPGDMELIRQPMDFLGLNIYDGRVVKAAANPQGFEVVPFAPGHPQTAFRWFIVPEALRWGPRLLWERYKVPIAITENGLSSIDWVSEDGKVHDPQRIDYTSRYLKQLERAIGDGVDVRAYLHWSLMDNFEWAAGYRERFGLVHVDFATGVRTPKDSCAWYRRVIETNGGSLHDR